MKLTTKTPADGVNPAVPEELPAADAARDFIREIVIQDLQSGKHRTIKTRFPPEPNGYLHIGHAKSICLNFGIAQEFGGVCHLRFDDTNPTTEDPEYVAAIQRDVRWLGFDWGPHLYHAADYFAALYQFAIELIRVGLAYVCSLSEEEIREYRGTLSQPGRLSPYRERTISENLDLFARMRAGEFADGTHVLRAKIDMAATNMKMRDPLLYRIRKAHHYRSGDAWPIYPMYDFAHCLSDALEGITHSLCTLEFENNRELYDWVIEHTPVPCRPRQIEFARLNLSYTVMSKRKLLKLVEEGHVTGWDDPRMPTLSGLRRRGYTPEAIRNFCERIGIARTFNVIDVALLEHSLRDDLNAKAPRVLGVLRPLKVVIENYPAGVSESFTAPYFPHDVPQEGSRELPFSREIWIEQDDFLEDPPPNYFRLAPGREVRLRYAYLVRCVGVVKGADGEVVEVRCTYDPATRGGNAPDGRKVAGTIHWVAASHALSAEVRLYDRLFSHEQPDTAGDDFRQFLNPDSLVVLPNCRVEPSLAESAPGAAFQFERLGYFCVDRVDSRPGALVFNRTVTLRDTWAKVAGKAEAQERDLLAAEKTAKKAAHKAQQRELTPTPTAARTAQSAEQQARLAHYQTLGLSDHDAWRLAESAELADFFARALTVHAQPQTVANWIINELLREIKDRPLAELAVSGEALGELVAMVDAGKITAKVGKDVLALMLQNGGRPHEIVVQQGWEPLADDVLAHVVAAVLAEHPDKVAAWRAGKSALFSFFVGQVMQKTQGRAHPQKTAELLAGQLR